MTWKRTTSRWRCSELRRSDKCHTGDGKPTWRLGGAAGIAQSGIEPWTAHLVHRNNGLHLGVTMFRPTAMVFDGTSEELAQRLVSVLEGTRTTRLQTNRGVVSHLVRNNRRPDLRTMLAAVGFNVTYTNPSAASPMQSFITEGDASPIVMSVRREFDEPPPPSTLVVLYAIPPPAGRLVGTHVLATYVH